MAVGEVTAIICLIKPPASNKRCNIGTLRRSPLSLTPDILYWLETFKTVELRAAQCLGWYFWWIMWECMCMAVIWDVCVRGNLTVWGFNAPRGAELCWWSWECWCDVSGMMTHSMRSARGPRHTHTHTHTRIHTHTHAHTHTYMHIHWYVQVLVVSRTHTHTHTHTHTVWVKRISALYTPEGRNPWN